jgi:hypothetical protein
MADKSCGERVQGAFKSELETLRELWDVHTGREEENDDVSEDSFYEHGLSFEYVAGDEDRPGFFRYLISWGGPSTEFRFFADGSGYNWKMWKCEFWLLDWFDGAYATAYGDDKELMNEIFQNFAECGSCEHAVGQAIED